MHFSLVLAGVIAGASASQAQHWDRRAQNASPCAQVSASAKSQLAASPSATPIVSASVAYECLNSVPLHKTEALELMNSILPYVKWQSDTAYMLDPPKAFTEPAADINGGLQKVISNIKSGAYKNEYTFQADLFRTFNLMHDGHLRFFPDLLTSVLSFSRNVGLVSVSLNATDVPQVYTHDDITSYVAGGKTPSPVSTINGEDAVTMLSALGQLGSLNDPDALYNSVFFSKPFGASAPGWEGYFSGAARFGYIYPGTKTTFVFKNGTSSVIHASSKVIGDFTGVTDGESAYAAFCNPIKNGVAAAAAATATATAASAPTPTPGTPAPGYPIPEVITHDNTASGYFLNSTANSDVAVLAMLSFEPIIPSEFQAVIQQFLAEAKAAGKKKLVIDVSANGGGIILNGYDAFRQLFPQIVQDGYTRYRYTEALGVMAEQFATSLEGFSPDSASPDEINAYESFANYKYDLDIKDNQFKSLDAKFGPHEYNGDNFTSIMRWNLNDPLTTTNATYGLGMEMTGYGTRRNFTQPFAAEDIIILYDGYCASTCTLFSEFMRTQGHVKSIAIGGRPSKDPMQGIGGIKGANNDAYNYLQFLAGVAYESGTPAQQGQANWTVLTDMTLLATNRSTDNSINVRDNILPTNVVDGVPAQFIYEAADCRLFYEPEMVVDVSAMWEAAADAAWGEKKCAQGSLPSLNKRTLTKKHNDLNPRKAPGVSRLPKGTFIKAVTGKFWANRHGTSIPK